MTARGTRGRGAEYRALAAIGMRQSDIARQFGVTRQAVSSALGGRAAHLERCKRYNTKQRGGKMPQLRCCTSCGEPGHNRLTCWVQS